MSTAPADRGSVPLDRYCNIDEVQSACINLAQRYQGLAALKPLPERTHGRNKTHALHITGAAQQSVKPVFMVIGGLHGSEWGSCEILLSLAADLLGAYEQQLDLAYGTGGVSYSAAQVTGLLDAIDFVLLPLANPDGRRHSQDVAWWWRKNRNPANQIGEIEESIGVDINRNFDFLFDFTTAFVASGTGISTSSDPSQSCYQGPAAFSEPEARNVRWLLEQFPTTRWFVDLHCGAQDVIYPWGDDEAQHVQAAMNFRNPAFDQQRGVMGDAYAEYQDIDDRRRMHQLAKIFANTGLAASGTHYGAVPGFVFTPCCGTSHDWVYARHLVDPNLTKTLAFAIEWSGDGPGVPWSEMPRIIEDVSAGLIAMGRAVLPSP
jgi:murein tripeptide amidase MpaA